MPRRNRQADAVTTICFVRHGATPTTGKVLPGRARGLHLSEAGRAEAEDTAQRFDGVPVAAIYTSPLERARETAAAISRHTGRRAVVERGLLECDFGDWTGAELSKLAKLPEWKSVQRYPSGWRFPGGESFVELQWRLVATVDRLRSRHPGETIVAVSHADCIKAVVASALGVPLDLFQRIVIGTCSTSVIAYGAAGPVVCAVNSYAPLVRIVPALSGAGTRASEHGAGGAAGSPDRSRRTEGSTAAARPAGAGRRRRMTA